MTPNVSRNTCLTALKASPPSPEESAAFDSLALYTCYHKPARLFAGDIVIPIQVGAALAAVKLPMLQDCTGDNISDKNPHFCELTATYWIWKNATADVVGLFHYRRFLNLRNNLRMTFCPDEAHFLEEVNLTPDCIRRVLERCDVILPCPVLSKGKNMREHYAERHEEADLELCLKLIAERYPHMAQTSTEVVDDRRSLGSFGNLLICRKPLFDEYAAWLFDILFELERRIHPQVLTRNAYQQRIYGFLAERLLNIFFAYQCKTAGLRICHVPIIEVTEDRRKWKKYRWKRRKHKLLKTIGINKRTWEEDVLSTI